MDAPRVVGARRHCHRHCHRRGAAVARQVTPSAAWHQSHQSQLLRRHRVRLALRDPYPCLKPPPSPPAASADFPVPLNYAAVGSPGIAGYIPADSLVVYYTLFGKLFAGCWHMGGSQTDVASLTAKDVDWHGSRFPTGGRKRARRGGSGLVSRCSDCWSAHRTLACIEHLLVASAPMRLLVQVKADWIAGDSRRFSMLLGVTVTHRQPGGLGNGVSNW